MIQVQVLKTKSLQQKIDYECKKVDEEYNNNRINIEDYKKKITEVMNAVKGEKKKLGELSNIQFWWDTIEETKSEVIGQKGQYIG